MGVLEFIVSVAVPCFIARTRACTEYSTTTAVVTADVTEAHDGSLHTANDDVYACVVITEQRTKYILLLYALDCRLRASRCAATAAAAAARKNYNTKTAVLLRYSVIRVVLLDT